MPIPSPSSVLLRTQSDERLVLLARAGHERAFEAIVERYRALLLRSARRYLPESRAEDALQQAYIAAWRALQRGDEVRDLRAWLYRIVHNTALNQLRSAGYDYAELEESLRGGSAPQEELERRAVVRQTLTGLAALPERQREALLRIAIEGRSQEEVARELGVTEGAVRQLVHRARLTLRAAATALIPLPVATWAAAAGAVSGAGPPSAERIAELIAGAGAGAFAAKAGAVAVIATTTAAVAGPTIVTNRAEPPARAARPPAERVVATPEREPSRPVVVPAATATAEAPRGESAPSRGERRRERTRDRSRSRRGSGSSGSSGSGSSGSGSSGSGSSGSGSSGSGFVRVGLLQVRLVWLGQLRLGRLRVGLVRLGLRQLRVRLVRLGFLRVRIGRRRRRLTSSSVGRSRKPIQRFARAADEWGEPGIGPGSPTRHGDHIQAMRILARTLSALVLAALVALVPATAASAAKKPKVATWAKKHHLSGSWRAKDADKDAVKNFAEYKLGTNPRKADSDKDGLKDGDEVKSANNPVKADTDKDGVKDGAEHAGVVTAFDGEEITIRQFKGGTLTAAVDDACDGAAADDSSFDEDFSDDGFAETDEGEWEDFGDGFARAASVDEDEDEAEDDPELDLGDDEDATCDLVDVEKGDVLTSAELENRDGDTYVVAVEIA